MSEWQSRSLDARFLLDSGLLFEINRTVLHLFGIALTADVIEILGVQPPQELAPSV